MPTSFGTRQREKLKTKKKTNLCRVPNSRRSAKKDVAEHRYVGQPMPSAAFLPRVWHSAKKSFAECSFLPSAWHSAKNSLPSVILYRVRHSAKKVFAECLIFNTRQRILHSVKYLFPVVQDFFKDKRTRIGNLYPQTTSVSNSQRWSSAGVRQLHCNCNIYVPHRQFFRD